MAKLFACVHLTGSWFRDSRSQALRAFGRNDELALTQARQCVDELCARLRQRQPARREGVTVEKKSRQGEGIEKIVQRRRRAVLAHVLAQEEDRKPHQLVAIRFAGGARHRPARPRRYEDELVLCAGRGASRQVQPEPEFGEEVELKARDHRRDRLRVLEPVQDRLQCVVDRGMRLAFGKEPARGGEMGDPMQRMRLIQKTGSAQIGRLDEVKPEMLVEPRPPGCAHRISSLQDPAQSRSRTAAHQPEMAPMGSGHQFKDDAGFAVALDAEYDAFVDPFHDAYLYILRMRAPRGAARYSFGNSKPIAR